MERSPEGDSLQSFIRRAASQVQRWNTSAREFEKKAKRSKQLALDAGLILAELSGLEEGNAADITTARRLVQKLENGLGSGHRNDSDSSDRDANIESASAQSRGTPRHQSDTSGIVSRKRKRDSDDPPNPNLPQVKTEEMEILIENDDFSLQEHSPDYHSTVEASNAAFSRLNSINSSPPHIQRFEDPHLSSSTSKPRPASSASAVSPPPAKKQKGDSSNPSGAPLPSAKKSSALSPAAVKARDTLRAAKSTSSKKVTNEDSDQAPPPVLQKLFDTFADRKACRVLRSRLTTMQPCHKVKPRCISFSPTLKDTFVTSALDGTISFWRERPNARPDEKRCEDFGFLDRAKLRQSRFPSDMSWHEGGNRLAVLFSAENEEGSASTSPVVENKVENAQLVIFNTTQLPHVPAFFVPNKPHRREPKRSAFHSVPSEGASA